MNFVYISDTIIIVPKSGKAVRISEIKQLKATTDACHDILKKNGWKKNK